jgi:hypothetical protein
MSSHLKPLVVIAQSSHILASTLGKIYSVVFHESSYRSELYGMQVGVVLLQHIIKAYSIIIPKQKTFSFYCKNQSVINMITSCLDPRRTVNQHQHPDVDIEQISYRVTVNHDGMNYSCQDFFGLDERLLSVMIKSLYTLTTNNLFLFDIFTCYTLHYPSSMES